MISIEQLTAFFGWCAVLNSAVLAIATVAAILVHRWLPEFHAKLLGLREADVKAEYFRFLSTYKLVVVALNIVPYVALKILQ